VISEAHRSGSRDSGLCRCTADKAPRAPAAARGSKPQPGAVLRFASATPTTSAAVTHRWRRPPALSLGEAEMVKRRICLFW
jgi:hypothetical protein